MQTTAKIFYTAQNFAVADFDNSVWRRAEQILLDKYWSGAAAPLERHATARLLWTEKSFCARFDCAQHEPFVVSQNPRIDVEADKLWERDVCEIFVAPNLDEPEKYFEFEVAPTGEWLDYAVHQLPNRRQTDVTYNSGIVTAAKIFENSFSVIFSIEWSAFNQKPSAGEEWKGNLMRCVGAGETRGYLTWQPTRSETPNFHVPAAFGKFKFTS